MKDSSPVKWKLSFPSSSAQQMAAARLYDMVNAQAQALSYVEVYWLLSMISVVMFFFCFSLAKNESGALGGVRMH